MAGKRPVKRQKPADPRARRTRYMDLRAIDMFMTIADCGSMTEAARRLGLTQPGISKALAQLESDFGAVLIDRNLRPLRATRAGLALQKGAKSLLNNAEGIRSAVTAVADEVLPSLRIGLIASFTATGAPLVRSLQSMADEVRISSNLTPDLARRLQQRDLDLLITSDPMEDEPDFERLPILGEPFVLVVSASYAREHPTTLSALAAQSTLIRYTNRSIIGSTIERHLRRHRIDAPHHLEFDSSSALLTMVSAGLGWTITTPLCIIQGQVPLSELTILPMREAPLRRHLYIITRANELVGIREKIHQMAMLQAKETLSKTFRGPLTWIMDAIDFSKSAP